MLRDVSFWHKSMFKYGATQINKIKIHCDELGKYFKFHTRQHGKYYVNLKLNLHRYPGI